MGFFWQKKKKLAWDLGYKKIMLESDDSGLVQRLLCGNSSAASLLFLQIKELMNRDWMVGLYYIQHDCNRIADTLAKIGLSKSAIMGDCPMYLRT